MYAPLGTPCFLRAFCCALRRMRVVTFFVALDFVLSLRVLAGRRRVLGVERLVYEESSLYGWVNEGEGET